MLTLNTKLDLEDCQMDCRLIETSLFHWSKSEEEVLKSFLLKDLLNSLWFQDEHKNHILELILANKWMVRSTECHETILSREIELHFTIQIKKLHRNPILKKTWMHFIEGQLQDEIKSHMMSKNKHWREMLSEFLTRAILSLNLDQLNKN